LEKVPCGVAKKRQASTWGKAGTPAPTFKRTKKTGESVWAACKKGIEEKDTPENQGPGKEGFEGVFGKAWPRAELFVRHQRRWLGDKTQLGYRGEELLGRFLGCGGKFFAELIKTLSRGRGKGEVITGYLACARRGGPVDKRETTYAGNRSPNKSRRWVFKLGKERHKRKGGRASRPEPKPIAFRQKVPTDISSRLVSKGRY